MIPETIAKPFRCKNCGALLGHREGDELVTPVFRLLFPVSTLIRCLCGAKTRFNVTPKQKGFDRMQKSAKI